jgi:hypothetical protein
MVDMMVYEILPEDLPNRQLAPVEIGYDVVKLLRPQAAKSGHCFLVDPLVPGSQQPHFPGALEIRRFVLEPEPSGCQGEADAGVYLTEVPGEFSDRPSLRVGAEVVLIGRKRLENPNRVLGFGIPCVTEPVKFGGWHGKTSEDGH